MKRTAMDPNTLDADYMLSATLSFIESNQYARALDCITKVITYSDANSIYYRQRSEIYSMMHRFDKAAEDMRRALHLDPDDFSAYYLLGGNLLSHELALHGRIHECTSSAVLDEISSCYTLSLEINPTSSAAWIDLLELHLVRRQWDNAIACYGSSRHYISDSDLRLLRSFLGCLAIVLVGDDTITEDEKELKDTSILISRTRYRFGEIASLLRELRLEGYYSDRLDRANWILDRFIEHIDQT